MASLLHETVRQELVRRVNANEYEAGTALPSAATLAQEFNVSTITVKRALRDLQTAGVLRTEPGRGTYVRERRRFIRDLDVSFSSLEDARRLGLDVSIDQMSVSRERASDPGFEPLGAPAGLMLCVRKKILVDGTVLMHDTSYLPSSLGDEVIEDFARKFIMEALQERGVRFTGTRLLIDAAPASKEAQAAFDIPAGYPTLRRLYRMQTTEPDFFVLGIAESPFDRLACTVEIGLPGGSAPRRRKGSKPLSLQESSA